MIPGLPLDGGNVLKSIVWKITGNPNKGVIFAGRVGQVIGWLAISTGILSILGISQIGSFWTLLIGVFLLQNAGFAAQSAVVQDKLSQYQAQDAVIADSPIVSIHLTVREFVNDYVIGKERWKKFLVVDENQQLLGAITTEALKQIPTSQWNEIYLKELVKPVPEDDIILADTSLLEVAKTIETKNANELVVVSEAGKVLGLLEKASIINLMTQQQLKSNQSTVLQSQDSDEILLEKKS
jgi:CBS domain-containing protein